MFVDACDIIDLFVSLWKPDRFEVIQRDTGKGSTLVIGKALTRRYSGRYLGRYLKYALELARKISLIMHRKMTRKNNEI